MFDVCNVLFGFGWKRNKFFLFSVFHFLLFFPLCCYSRKGIHSARFKIEGFRVSFFPYFKLLCIQHHIMCYIFYKQFPNFIHFGSAFDEKKKERMEHRFRDANRENDKERERESIHRMHSKIESKYRCSMSFHLIFYFYRSFWCFSWPIHLTPPNTEREKRNRLSCHRWKS